MKLLLMSLIWTTLSMIHPDDQHSGSMRIHSGWVTPVSNSIQPKETVLTFLNWYKANRLSANRISLVNQQAGKPYSVNLKNGERYLTYLQGSHLLTNTYLNEWRTYFKERNEGFRLSPQYEGTPTGFEYDLVLLSQEVDSQLAALKTLKVDKVTVTKTRATIMLTLLDTYEFKLVRSGNRWMINEILNMSQE